MVFFRDVPQHHPRHLSSLFVSARGVGWTVFLFLLMQFGSPRLRVNKHSLDLRFLCAAFAHTFMQAHATSFLWDVSLHAQF